MHADDILRGSPIPLLFQSLSAESGWAKNWTRFTSTARDLAVYGTSSTLEHRKVSIPERSNRVCLHPSSPKGGPRVRILFPPAESHLRTWLSGPHPVAARVARRGEGAAQRALFDTTFHTAQPKPLIASSSSRGAEVNVLSMSGRAGTAASALADLVARISSRQRGGCRDLPRLPQGL